MKRSLKSLISMFAVVAILLVAGMTLTSCGGVNDYITPSRGASFSGSDVKFTNASDFSLTYQGDNKYEANGSANTMSKEQASAWGTVEGSKYVVLNVKMGVDGSAIIGWRNKETADKPFEESEIDGSLIKRSTASNETKNYILAISDGDTYRHEELPIWRIEVTEKDATETKVFTVDFSKLYNA